MIALDTNVVLRLIVLDNSAQVARARDIISEPCFVSTAVLMETGWVLQRAYGYSRQELARALLRFCQIETLTLAHPSRIRWALNRLASVNADFADLLHLADCGPADEFATFDRKLRLQAGEDAPVAVTALG